MKRSIRYALVPLTLVLMSTAYVAAQRSEIDSPGAVKATLILQTTPSGLFASNPKNVTSRGDFLRTQAAILKSRLVLGPVLRNPKIAELAIIQAEKSPLDWLERHLTVTLPSDSPTITVALRGSEREQLAIIVNAVVNTYLTVIVVDEQRVRREQHDSLQVEFDKVQVRLREKRFLLNMREGKADVEDRKALISDSLKRMDQELHQLKLQRAETQVKLDRRKAKKGPAEEIPLLEERLEIISAQELVLEKEVESVRRQWQNFEFVDLATDREEISLIAATAKVIGRELEHLRAEMNTPMRVLLLSPAGAD